MNLTKNQETQNIGNRGNKKLTSGGRVNKKKNSYEPISHKIYEPVYYLEEITLLISSPYYLKCLQSLKWISPVDQAQ